ANYDPFGGTNFDPSRREKIGDVSIIVVRDFVIANHDTGGSGLKRCVGCATADPNSAIVVNVVVENVHAKGQPHPAAVVQQNFAILDRPVCSLRQRCIARHSNGAKPNRHSKFLMVKWLIGTILAVLVT